MRQVFIVLGSNGHFFTYKVHLFLQGMGQIRKQMESETNKTEVVNDASLSNFFIFHFFFHFFHFFTLLVAPSSLSLLPRSSSLLVAPPSSLLPRRSFLAVGPSSSSLLPTLFISFRICKSRYFIKFDESVTNRRTNQRTDGQGLL